MLNVIHSSKIIFYYKGQAEAYLEPSRTSVMEPFCENSYQFKTFKYFRKEALTYLFEWVLNKIVADNCRKSERLDTSGKNVL